MKKALLLGLVYALTMEALGHQSDAQAPRSDVLLVAGRPTIHITFDGEASFGRGVAKLAAGAGSSDGSDRKDGDRSNGAIRLRLHNNTRWAISFSTESLYVGTAVVPLRLGDGRTVLALRTGTQVNAEYQIEPDRLAKGASPARGGPPMEETVTSSPIDWGDVSATSWLPSGACVTFLVPRNLSLEHSRLYVAFAYEWESIQGASPADEPQHRVYYRAPASN